MSSHSFELKSQIIQAGAGTGKTARLTKEVFRTLQDFKKQHHRYPGLMVCTFTRKATQELKTRLYQKAIQSGDRELLTHISSPFLYISTIHGILALFLKNHSYKYGCHFSRFESDASIKEGLISSRVAADLLFGKYFPLLEKVSFSVLKRALELYTKSKFMNPNIRLFSEEDLKQLQEKDQLLVNKKKEAYLSDQKWLPKFFENCLKEPECFEFKSFARIFDDFVPSAEEFSKEFLKQKKREGVVTVEDLELWTLDLLNKSPETGRLFSDEWDYWFIDEYQDTSRVQERIIQKITGFKNVFCVGDPQQSIYLFRGADPEVFKRRVKALKESQQTLKINYRSQGPLIHFFNDFFPKERGFLQLSPSKNSDVKNTKENPPVYFIYYDGESPFQEAVYFQIQRLLKKGNSFGDITVLGIKNDHLSHLAQFLRKKGLPVRMHSSRGLIENRLVLDALFLLKFLINPHDDENFLALCRTPYFRVSDGELAEWCQKWRQLQQSFLSERNEIHKDSPEIKLFPEKNWKKEKTTRPPLSLWNFVREQQTSKEMIQILKTYIHLKQERGILLTFEQALFDRGPMDLTEFQDPSGVSESHLWSLLAQIHETRNSMKHPLTLFYSLMEEREGEISFQKTPPTESSDFVQLMTIHSSKGLQFKNVIVFDLTKPRGKNRSPGQEDCFLDQEKGRMAFAVPLNGRDQKKIKCYGHKRYLENKKHQEIEETDRLLYVALTRAEDTVTIMAPSSKSADTWFERFNFFRNLENKPSESKQKGSLQKNSNTKTEEEHKNKRTNQSIPSAQATSIKTGFHVRDKYCFLVEQNPIEKASHPIKTSPPPLSLPLQTKTDPTLIWKTASDFVKDTNQSPQDTGFILEREKNIFLKTGIGRYLHDCLKLLTSHPLTTLQEKISCSGFSEKEKNQIKAALQWTMQLTEPDMSHFLKTGFAEWPIQWKTNSLILQGRIDLWGWKDSELWVFDYKSALEASPSVHHQLAFYSYALEQIYQPKKIMMCGIYPFAQKTDCVTYSNKHKQQVSHWVSCQTGVNPV